jgi:hypothetical protein
LELQALSNSNPLQKIDVAQKFEQVQVGIIDMQDQPDDGYHPMLHAKDNFSNLSSLFPQP